MIRALWRRLTGPRVMRACHSCAHWRPIYSGTDGYPHYYGDVGACHRPPAAMMPLTHSTHFCGAWTASEAARRAARPWWRP